MFSILFDGNAAVALRTITNVFSDKITDITFQVTDQRFFIQQMLNESIGVIEVTINKSAFSSYVCQGVHEISLNLNFLKKVLALDKGTIRWSMQNPSDDVMSIELSEGDVYDVKLTDLEFGELATPDLDYAFEGYLNAKKFFSKMIDINKFIEQVDFSLDPVEKQLLFSGTGDECTIRGSLPYFDDKESEGVTNLAISQLDSSDDEDEEEDEEIDKDRMHQDLKICRFSIKLMSDVAKIADIDKSFRLCLGDDFPMKIVFELDGISLYIWFAQKFID